MFTGIVECLGKVEAIEMNGSNKSFWINSVISARFSKDQSISHDGVCLTIEDIVGDTHKITAIKETLDKTNLDAWVKGDSINLERSLTLGERIDGHIVQGHVDDTATCILRKDLDGSCEFTFWFQIKFAAFVIEKGSVCVNGVSLTACNVGDDHFTVAIIPYTFENTNFSGIVKGSKVNIEFDMIGKYVVRLAELRKIGF